MLRFGGLASAALVACSGGRGDAGSTARPSLEPSARDISGPYWCAIDDAGYEYPRYACVIKRVGDRLVLAKLAGSQRLRGQVTLDGGDGFAFDGEIYCTATNCTEAMSGRFRPMGKGGFKGTLRGPLDPDALDAQAGPAHDTPEAPIIVTMFPAPANAFGGSSYGGDGYGDPFGMVGGGEADSTIDKP